MNSTKTVNSTRSIKYLIPATGETMTEVDNCLVSTSGIKIPLSDGVYNFTNDSNYTSNFGYQWNKFEKTQIDRYNDSINQSKKRLFAVTDWEENQLEGENILEVGSGAGRFSNVILKHTKARLFSVDYSDAVFANFRNNGDFGDRFKLFQASIYELPFEASQFDKVFCFGVLQHTPDFEKSIESLARMVKPGGELIVDFYPIRGWWTKIHAKYFFRPFTRKMNPEKLLKVIENNIGWLMNSYKLLNGIGLHVLTRFLPICDIKNTLPDNLKNDTLREWVILDTFDMFSPMYDNPQTIKKVKSWFENSGMKHVMGSELTFDNNKISVVRGVK